MTEDKYREITIEWQARLPWNSEEFEQNNINKVLYQIYCDSHIYGKSVLAYIGKTDRTFQERLSEHEKSFFQFANNVNYSIGTIKDFEGNLEIPESILIANHKPFFNKSFLHHVSLEATQNKIIILNNGNLGSLKNSCTNYWWVNKNIKEIIKKIIQMKYTEEEVNKLLNYLEEKAEELGKNGKISDEPYYPNKLPSYRWIIVDIVGLGIIRLYYTSQSNIIEVNNVLVDKKLVGFNRLAKVFFKLRDELEKKKVANSKDWFKDK